MKYDLTKIDSNAFMLLGYTKKAMKECKFPQSEIKKIMDEAMGGDYNNLVATLQDAIDKCNQRCGDMED
jgi:hypothetical protein